MKHRVLALALVFLAVLINSCGQSSNLPNDVATVLQVVDGDTVVLDFHGSTETVRLIGIDTPETVHPSKPVECFGPQASAYLHALLKPDTHVRIQRDIEARDRYNRLLVYIYLLDDTFVNDELLRQGFARTLRIEPNTTFATQFASTETGARANRVGLWQAC